jgi:hypothetical protein
MLWIGVEDANLITREFLLGTIYGRAEGDKVTVDFERFGELSMYMIQVDREPTYIDSVQRVEVAVFLDLEDLCDDRPDKLRYNLPKPESGRS